MGEFRSAKVFQRGDMITVRLKDNTFRTYFEGKANINNLKEMEQLKDDLRQKGVPL